MGTRINYSTLDKTKSLLDMRASNNDYGKNIGFIYDYFLTYTPIPNLEMLLHQKAYMPH